MSARAARLKICTAALSVGLLAACGGGGGAISTPTPPSSPIVTPSPSPAPSPTPAPTPAPSPTPSASFGSATIPSQFNTAEVRRSDGVRAHAPYTAWQSGNTGQGVTIAVVDSGIDQDLPDLSNRVSPLSRDMTGSNRPLEGPDLHGTQVALFAAAARNNSGIVGVAYDATILALRSDDPGSCDGGECQFSDSTIADSISYAASNGAKIINISLGGEGATRSVLSAVRTAVNAGALIVVSAGNESEPDPSSFAAMIADAGQGGVIIAGSVNDEGTISDFSNRAGAQSANYLTALGDGLCCLYDTDGLYTDDNGYLYVVSGTSYSAPLISGAGALLAEAFPNLTGAQIAQLLLDSAIDAGAVGTDEVYGRGILDIAAAFAPSGTTSIAGTNIAVSSANALSGVASGVMGDALTAASLPGVVLDSYQRAYQMDLAASMRNAAPLQRLRKAIETPLRQTGFATDRASVSFSFSDPQTDLSNIAQPLYLRDDTQTARVLAARIALKVAPRTKLAFAYAEGSDGIAAQLQGQEQPAFLIAPSATDVANLRRRENGAFALRREFGDWGVTVDGSRGEFDPGFYSADQLSRELSGERAKVADFGVALDRRIGNLQGAFELTVMREQRTMLGARFPVAFGMRGADTLFVDARVGWQVAPRLRFGGQIRQGFTSPDAGGLVVSGSQISSRAWSFEVTREQVLAVDDRVSMRVSQPLRVESGALDLGLPVGWSYDTMKPEYGVRSLNLTPRGREMIGELAWRGVVEQGNAAASLFYRRDPGHFAALPDDVGIAMRWSRGF